MCWSDVPCRKGLGSGRAVSALLFFLESREPFGRRRNSAATCGLHHESDPICQPLRRPRNMSATMTDHHLVQCRTCSGNVAQATPSCPHCGEKEPAKSWAQTQMT